MGITAADRNRSIRKEALRDQLSAQGHVQHVIDIADKLTDLEVELDQSEVVRLKSAADIKLKLIAKYLPDLKAIELSGEISTRPMLVDLSGGKLSEAMKHVSETDS